MHLRRSAAWAAVGLYGQECPILCEILLGLVGGPERQVFRWVMCGPKKLDFNQVNRMEKKYFGIFWLRGQQAPSAPTTEITGQKQAGLV